MNPILYLGDDNLQGAAAYLAGVLTHQGIEFRHISSTKAVGEPDLAGVSTFILSDYPASNFKGSAMALLSERVRNGGGLLMVGGWESFHGKAGEYAATPIEEILPVQCLHSDDRANYCQGLALEAQKEHVILAGLSLQKPPIVCGYNRVDVKKDSQLILALRPICIRAGQISFLPEKIPLLAIGSSGNGRTAAFATGFAPHWVGGLVDWGESRVEAQSQGGNAVEVGSDYARLIGNLVRWVANL